MDVPDLQVKTLDVRREWGDVDDGAFRVDLDGLTGFLLGDERVPVRESFTAEHLMGWADVVEHGLAAGSDLADSGGFTTIPEQDVAVGEDLEDDRDAWRRLFPDHFACCIEFDEAVRAFPVFGEEEAALRVG